jgi:hypothetical protein
MKKSLVILALSISPLLFSCASDSSNDLIPVETNEPGETPTIETYDGSIKAIVDSSCATTNCHDNVTKQSGVDLSTFASTKTGFSGRAMVRAEAGTMPPAGALPSTTIAKIQNWIDNDFKEN